jgi:hypothetical protein
MSATEHQPLLRRYLEARHTEGAKAIEALLEMQAWVSENIKAEHDRLWRVAEMHGAPEER